MTLVYVGVGLAAIASMTWAGAGIGVWMLGKAYLHFVLRRVDSDDPGDADHNLPSPDPSLLAAFKRVGIAYAVAGALLVVAWIAGEGWGWLVLAFFFTWLGILLRYGERLGPREMPARWFP